MYGISPQAYDRAITVFSPDGRLFQVEYAKQAVKKGATAIGVVAKDGVVLISHKMVYNKLVMPESLKKIFQIDDHIACTASGLIADARKLIDNAQLEAQKHKLTYNEPIQTKTLVKSICDLMQVYTQYGGIRPFGVSLLIIGYDDKPYLYEAEPSGAMTGYKADAIGMHKKEVDNYLEKHYKENLSLNGAVKLGINALSKSAGRLKPDSLEIALIDNSKKVKILSKEEISKYL